MSEAPWLTLVGLGEDGLNGLPPASLEALENASVVMGPARHLDLIGPQSADVITWPVPFADGVSILLEQRGKATVVLVSGDPFWHGAGTSVTKHLQPKEWRALPGPSCFALTANRLGWPMDKTHCIALHAAPMDRLRPFLAEGNRVIATLRDGDAVTMFTDYLSQMGFGETTVFIFESLGGPNERCSTFQANNLPRTTFKHPLVAAILPKGGPALSLATGRDDGWFDNDGQITKRVVRAATLSSLAPRPAEHLWDIGGGSGSIAIEWLLCDHSLTATCLEKHPQRAARIQKNALALGQDRLNVVQGEALDVIRGLPKPDAIFVGGGLSDKLLNTLRKTAPSARIVANAVTLESEALLLNAHAEYGGQLTKIVLSNPVPIGPKHGWQASYPILQWSFTP